jgi:hypothetical protein
MSTSTTPSKGKSKGRPGPIKTLPVYPYGQTPPGPDSPAKAAISSALKQDARNHTRKLADIVGVYPC